MYVILKVIKGVIYACHKETFYWMINCPRNIVINDNVVFRLFSTNILIIMQVRSLKDQLTLILGEKINTGTVRYFKYPKRNNNQNMKRK